MPRPCKHPARLAAALCLLLAATAGAEAGEASRPKGVVELFTSEGCSSCPPADRVLADLADSGDVLALAYHVDYWDYLGWKDTLATRENTSRQKLYARRTDAGASVGSVFTPEAVVNGRAHIIGSKGELIRHTVTELGARGHGLPVSVNVARQGESIVVKAGAAPEGAGEAEVVLVSFIRERTVPIRGGENGGAAIRYVNAVTRTRTIGMWHGEAARYEMPAEEPDEDAGYRNQGLAVLIQRSSHGVPGAILGAAILD